MLSSCLLFLMDICLLRDIKPRVSGGESYREKDERSLSFCPGEKKELEWVINLHPAVDLG